MKKLTVFCSILLVFGIAGTANAALTTIGTATYGGNDYNLIYEDDSIDGGLVWLDYTRIQDSHGSQVAWASGIGSSLTVNLDPGYTTNIDDWENGWRLPLTQDAYEGFYATGSEMGHLYYVSLGNEPGWPIGRGLENTDPFNNFYEGDYWSESTSGSLSWAFRMGDGNQYLRGLQPYSGLAVHPGTVTAVPIPSAIWLLGTGLIGLVGFRRKFRKE